LKICGPVYQQVLGYDFAVSLLTNLITLLVCLEASSKRIVDHPQLLTVADELNE